MKWLCTFLLLCAVYWPATGQQPAGTGTGPDRPGSIVQAVKEWPSLLRVPFTLINNLPVVQVTVDGHTGNFILDTGAETTLLNKRYFAGMPASASTVTGATGTLKQTASYRATHIAWQDLVLTDATLTVTDLTHLGAAPLLGLLGADLLVHYAITFDYTNQIVILRASGEPNSLSPPQLSLPFTRRGHLPVISVTIANQAYDMAIDSGASVNMLTENLLPVLKNEISNSFTSSLSGASAHMQPVTGGTLKLVTLAHRLQLRDMATVFMTIGPLARNQPTPVAGILGYEFLRQYQVTINYPKGIIELR